MDAGAQWNLSLFHHDEIEAILQAIHDHGLLRLLGRVPHLHGDGSWWDDLLRFVGGYWNFDDEHMQPSIVRRYLARANQHLTFLIDGNQLDEVRRQTRKERGIPPAYGQPRSILAALASAPAVQTGGAGDTAAGERGHPAQTRRCRRGTRLLAELAELLADLAELLADLAELLADLAELLALGSSARSRARGQDMETDPAAAGDLALQAAEARKAR